MAPQWIHEASVEVQTSPEDWEEMTVALFVSGSPASQPYFDKSFGNYLPGDPADIELLSIEVYDTATKKWRKATPADPYAGESYDQNVLDAVETWWDSHADSCWDSLDEDGDEADYRRDAMQDRQMEAR